MCRTSLAQDDYTEDEIEAELAVIKAQLAYVFQVQGQSEKAAQIYQSVLQTWYHSFFLFLFFFFFSPPLRSPSFFSSYITSIIHRLYFYHTAQQVLQ